jgi:malonyl-ACP decarboxylase
MDAGADDVVVTGMGVCAAAAIGLDRLLAVLRSTAPGRGPCNGLTPQRLLLQESDIRQQMEALIGPLCANHPERRKQLARSMNAESLSVRAALTACAEAWVQARLDDSTVAANRIGIIVAGGNHQPALQWQAAMRYQQEPLGISPAYALRFMDTHVLGLLSEIFAIRGESFSCGAASASGNFALLQAWRMISWGMLDCCLVVGPAADLSPAEIQAFINLGALATDNEGTPLNVCRPFDRHAEGFVYSQGAGCLVVESRRSAQERQVTPVARLRGGAAALAGVSGPEPQIAAERAVMREALRNAGLSVHEVQYISAHATGTPLGDEAELTAIEELFGDALEHIVINSSKCLLGHALWSAGLLEAIATILQIRNRFVHGNSQTHEPRHTRRAHAVLGPEGREDVTIENALSNSFGFSGIVSTLVIGACGSKEIP